MLTAGTMTLAAIKPTSEFFFLIILKIKPANAPANVHLSRHTRIVAGRLTGMKKAIVECEKRAIIPLKKPNIAPDIGPHNTAAKTTGTSEILIFASPMFK